MCIWIRSDSGLWAYADNMDIYRYYQASYICLTVCALIFIISILGCAGASKESEILMFVVSSCSIFLKLNAKPDMVFLVLCSCSYTHHYGNCCSRSCLENSWWRFGNYSFKLYLPNELITIDKNIFFITQLQYSLSNEFKWHMEQRLYNSKSRQFLDLIQLKLECCGAQTMLDYRNMYQDIPASCNSPRTNNINIRV